MKTKISKEELRNLILEGITSEELNTKYDYSHITDMTHLFLCCFELKTIPELDTSNVTDMYGMFYECSNLLSIPELDTSKVTNMYSMFSRCSNLISISNLDTSNVTDMEYIFEGCNNLKELKIENFWLYDFTKLDNVYLKENYPEYFI